MELLLNLLWLVVATLLVVQVWRHRVSTAKWAPSSLTVAVSIVCVAALLFPAISVSDDLHVQSMLAESPAKQIANLLANLDQPAAMLPIALVLLIVASQALGSQARLVVPPEAICTLLDGFLLPVAGRAPPVVSSERALIN